MHVRALIVAAAFAAVSCSSNPKNTQNGPAGGSGDEPVASEFTPLWPGESSAQSADLARLHAALAASAAGQSGANSGAAGASGPVGAGGQAGGAGGGSAGSPQTGQGGSAAGGASSAPAAGLCPMGRITVGGDRIRVTLQGDVLFDFDKHELKPAAAGILSTLKKSLIDPHPDARVVVEGHTDWDGSDAYNRTLSGKRANAVATWLSANGLAGKRVRRAGYGESRPRASNKTKKGRALNRRVELVVIRSKQAGAAPVAAAPTCAGVGACCELAKARGKAAPEPTCIGKTTAGQRPDHLAERQLELSGGVLRLDTCTKTRGGAVWITSSSEKKIAKLDERDGRQLFRVPTYGFMPQRTAVAADGSVWITNRDSGSYVHLGAKTGKLLCSSPLKTCQTRAAGVDSDGNIWIGCYREKKLIKVHPTETEGTVEVFDPLKRKEIVTAPKCKQLAEIQLTTWPYGIVGDRNGVIWTAVNGRYPVAKVDARNAKLLGEYKLWLDPMIAERSKCFQPYGVTIDRDGNPWYTNMMCGSLVKMDGRTGKVLGVFRADQSARMSHPRAAGVDRRGHIWVADNSTTYVHEFKPDGTWVKRVDLSECGGIARPGPLGTGSDSEGHMWTVLNKAGRVVQYKTDGTIIGCYGQGKVTPKFRNPYTYSDLTGSGLDLATSNKGRTRFRFSHKTPLRWRMVAMTAGVHGSASLCLRARVAGTTAGLAQAKWTAAQCPAPRKRSSVGVPLPEDLPRGAAIEVELHFGSSVAGRTAMVSDLTVAGE